MNLRDVYSPDNTHARCYIAISSKHNLSSSFIPGYNSVTEYFQLIAIQEMKATTSLTRRSSSRTCLCTQKYLHQSWLALKNTALTCLYTLYWGVRSDFGHCTLRPYKIYNIQGLPVTTLGKVNCQGVFGVRADPSQLKRFH